MCTTTFIKYHCNICDYLVRYDQKEDKCEHVKNNQPEMCQKKILSRKESIDIRSCKKCEQRILDAMKKTAA